jgi:hypothetical protein
MLEFFYFLELIRPIIIFYALYQAPPRQRFMQTAKQTLLHWLPYLAMFLLNVFYRAFVFTNINYQNVLLSDLRADPLGAGLKLLQTMASDLWLVSGKTWVQVFNFPNPIVDGPRTTLLYVFVVITVGILVIVFLHRYFKDENTNGQTPTFWMIGIGLAAMILGGGPYWLAGIELSLAFPASRFTMSFMLGVGLLLAGIIELLPARLRVIVAALFVAFAAGRMVMVSDSFRRDWDAQRSLFWQMFWRMPGLKPDTLVLMNEDLNYYADNSIGAPLNWIYGPEQSADQIRYLLLYPTNRIGKTLPNLDAGKPVNFNYLAGEFNGNTSDVLAFYYDPPACLRLLEPDLDKNNRFISDASLMREASTLSNADRITADKTALMPSIYGPEPAHGWCYYFQKADLARQLGDWETVVELGDQAFKLDDYPNNPVERFVFIEGYAHEADWDQAVDQSRIAYKVSKDYVGPLLCQLWKRIEAETDESPERSEALVEIRQMVDCPVQ